MSEKSIILIPDPKHDRQATILYGYPEGEVVVRGFDGAVLYDGREFRGEQPDSSALPDAGALRGDVPLSESERSEA